MNTINVNMNFYPDIAFTPCRYVRIVIYLTYSCYLKDLVYKHLQSSSINGANVQFFGPLRRWTFMLRAALSVNNFDACL